MIVGCKFFLCRLQSLLKLPDTFPLVSVNTYKLRLLKNSHIGKHLQHCRDTNSCNGDQAGTTFHLKIKEAFKKLWESPSLNQQLQHVLIISYYHVLVIYIQFASSVIFALKKAEVSSKTENMFVKFKIVVLYLKLVMIMCFKTF